MQYFSKSRIISDDRPLFYIAKTVLVELPLPCPRIAIIRLLEWMLRLQLVKDATFQWRHDLKNSFSLLVGDINVGKGNMGAEGNAG